MSCHVPTCTIPVHVPASAPASSPPICYPVGGVGSLTSGGLGSGGGMTASSLGLIPGAAVGCITQTPASELVIQPAPFMVTLPGAIVSASCEPVRVGGFTACGGGGSSGRNSRSVMSGSKSYICKS